LAKNESCLNGLSETNGIGDQDSRPAVAKHGKRRLKLVGMDIDCPGGGRKHAAKWARIDRRALQEPQPSPWTDDRDCGRIDIARTIEREQQRSNDRLVEWI